MEVRFVEFNNGDEVTNESGFYFHANLDKVCINSTCETFKSASTSLIKELIIFFCNVNGGILDSHLYNQRLIFHESTHLESDNINLVKYLCFSNFVNYCLCFPNFQCVVGFKMSFKGSMNKIIMHGSKHILNLETKLESFKV